MLDGVRRLGEVKIDPTVGLRQPLRYLKAPWIAAKMRAKIVSRGPVLAHETTIDQLPQQKSWPNDGGAFITLPLVYTEQSDEPGFKRSNVGMYRVQLSGGQYQPNLEVGLHYQIHRGIGVHHAAAIRRGEPLRVNVFVGGAPALTIAAGVPLPDDVSEHSFAGALVGRPMPLIGPAEPLPGYA